MSAAIRVLVVDDDSDVRSLLTAVLSRPPMTVVEAASGGEASRAAPMNVSPTRSTRIRAVVCALAAALLAGCSEGGGDPLVARGRHVYLAQCTQCHNVDPALDGPVGPAVKRASRDLLEAKVLRGEYPSGYRPKRATKVMPPQPTLAADVPALAAYLK